MIPKACMLDAGLVLFSLTVLTCMPTFAYAKNGYQPEHSRVSSSVVVETTAQAQGELNPNAPFGWSLESSGAQSLLDAGVLHESLMLLAQKEPKSEGKKPKAEAGKTGGKGSDASKKDDDEDEDEDEEEEDEDDDEEKGKAPGTKEEKMPKKGGSK